MPNKRDPNKKMLGGFVPEHERDAAHNLARLLGVTVTELIRAYIQEQCRIHGIDTTPPPTKPKKGKHG